LFGAPRLGIAAGVLLGALVATGVSWASIPDPSGVIHGCYKSNGSPHALSVIDSAKTATCPTGYKAVNWNQTGQQGPPGPSSGALIYEQGLTFEGPLTNGQQGDTFFGVPAGLMCVQGAASAYTTTTGTQLAIEYSDPTGVAPLAKLELVSNLAETHEALMSYGVDCKSVPAGNYTYDAILGTGTIFDANDFGSITVWVYSQ
jgi:hypothetical protein